MARMNQAASHEPARGPPGSGVTRDDLPRREVDRQALPPRGRGSDEPPRRQPRESDAITSPHTSRSAASDDIQGRTRMDLDRQPNFESSIGQHSQASDHRRPSQPRARDYERPSSYYEEVPTPSRESRDHWGPRPRRDEREPPAWDRGADVGNDRRAPQQMDRVRGPETRHPPPIVTNGPSPFDEEQGSTRGRRGRWDEALDAHESDGGMRPSIRRGGSLLERLSLDEPSPEDSRPPPPSLRERVAPPPIRTLPEVIGLPPRPSDETTYDAELALDASSRNKYKKRKVKRVRGAQE